MRLARRALRMVRRQASRVAAGLVLATLGGAPASAAPDGAQTSHAGQVWLGYMTQARLSEPLSLWNDAHLVPGGFFVLRTGVTVHLPGRVALTGGYAYLGLPVGGVTRDLKRQEHRPWAQAVHTQTLAERWRILQRVRYDARFRRNVGSEGLEPGYTLTHRVRLMVTARLDLDAWRVGDTVPYVTVGDELLLNFGPQVERNRIDQNRITAAVGLSRGGVSVQTGYMNRAVVLPVGDLVMNHTLLVWVFHNLDLRRAA